MKLINILIFLMGMCNYQPPPEINEFYNLHKNKNLNLFKNWHIYQREGQQNAYVFDYLNGEQVERRFYIIEDENKNIMYKQVFPQSDSIFHELTGNVNDKGLTLALFTDFKSLNIKSLNYLNDLNIVQIALNSYSVIYSEVERKDLSGITRFNDYKSIDSHWFYQSNN